MGETLLMMFRECRNFFNKTEEIGEFELVGGKIELSGAYLVGQYILIAGSVLNGPVRKITAVDGNIFTLDGIYPDESFTGVVYGLRVPLAFLELAAKVSEFVKGAGGPPKYVSESVIGVHSYTVATKDGVPLVWQDAFKNDIAPFRRMFTNISV